MPRPASVAAQSSVSATPGTLRRSSLRIARDHARDLRGERRVDAGQAGEDDPRLALDVGEVDIVIEAAAAKRVGEFARAVRGQHDARDGRRA